MPAPRPAPWAPPEITAENRYHRRERERGGERRVPRALDAGISPQPSRCGPHATNVHRFLAAAPASHGRGNQDSRAANELTTAAEDAAWPVLTSEPIQTATRGGTRHGPSPRSPGSAPPAARPSPSVLTVEAGNGNNEFYDPRAIARHHGHHARPAVRRLPVSRAAHGRGHRWLAGARRPRHRDRRYRAQAQQRRPRAGRAPGSSRPAHPARRRMPARSACSRATIFSLYPLAVFCAATAIVAFRTPRPAALARRRCRRYRRRARRRRPLRTAPAPCPPCSSSCSGPSSPASTCAPHLRAAAAPSPARRGPKRSPAREPGGPCRAQRPADRPAGRPR